MKLSEAFTLGFFRNKEEVDKYLHLFDGNTFVDTLNIVKSSDIMKLDYDICLDEAKNWLTGHLDLIEAKKWVNDSLGQEYMSFFDDVDFIDKWVNAVVIVYLIAKGINKFKSYNESTIRWDKYYYGLCNEVAKNSKCLSKQVGSVLVKDKTIVCTGYNGAPRGVPHCGMERYELDETLAGELDRYSIKGFLDSDIESKCPRQLLGLKSGEGLEWCIAGHAERNSLIQAAREGISTKGAILYINCEVPCTPCLVEIINAGIKEIVVTKKDFYDVSAKYLLENSDLNCRIYSFL